MEKIIKMEITILKDKEYSEELRKFKEEMIRAIKEAEVNLEAQQKNKGKDKTNDEIELERANSIKIIERKLEKKRGLKVKDLGEYSNYQDQIDNLNENWEVRELRNKITRLIRSIPHQRSDDNKMVINKVKIVETESKSLDEEVESNYASESGSDTISDLIVKTLFPSISKKIIYLEEQIKKLESEKNDLKEKLTHMEKENDKRIRKIEEKLQLQAQIQTSSK